MQIATLVLVLSIERILVLNAEIEVERRDRGVRRGSALR
jgi:hypothetical protein